MVEIGHEFHDALQLAFKTINNKVEYESLVTGLSIVNTLEAGEVEVKIAFKVVAN